MPQAMTLITERSTIVNNVIPDKQHVFTDTEVFIVNLSVIRFVNLDLFF